ncbi:hypothetical protein K501DRAFT_282042 [Backusella circina FSU 941]|nr:hypothetical protein K501DRAFT_282042 [Backusella circina FSU 941]
MHTTCLMLLVIPSPIIAETATTIYGFSLLSGVESNSSRHSANLSLHFAKVPPLQIAS